MNFSNIDLTIFNPYSGKFAGYSIAQGKLATQMHYHVEDNKLQATHHIVIDQLEFGAATENKPAVPLPIKLAAALLKDRHGVISIDLPVSGSVDDPKFRLAPLIGRALLDLMAKAVTAPFSWLGSLIGGGEQLAYIEFAAGSAQLPETGRQKSRSWPKRSLSGRSSSSTFHCTPWVSRTIARWLGRRSPRRRRRSPSSAPLPRGGAAMADRQGVGAPGAAKSPHL